MECGRPRPLPSRPGAKAGPQIAIVITGLGVSNATAAEALNKLPAAVTFALAPGGSGLDRLAGKARSLRHELLLQVPMEPFGIAGPRSRAASAARPRFRRSRTSSGCTG